MSGERRVRVKMVFVKTRYVKEPHSVFHTLMIQTQFDNSCA